MNTLKEIFNIFVGEYVPITYTDSNNISVVADGLAGIDWAWVMSSILLIIGIYSIFRIIGIVISKF